MATDTQSQPLALAADRQPGGPPLPAPAAGRLAQTVRLHRDPLGTLLRWRGELGPVFAVELLTGSFVVTATTDAVDALGCGDPETAHAGDARRAVLPQASPRSVFGADGSWHATARARIAPAFTAAAIDSHRPDIAAIAESHIAAWPQDRPFRVLPRMRAFADEVFVRCQLGVRDPARAQALTRAIGSLLWTPGNPPTSIPGPRDGIAGRIVAVEFGRRRARVARHLVDEFRERRAAGAQTDDVIGLLLAGESGADDEALVDELLAVIMAGQEPAAAALAWVVLRLARHGIGELADRELRPVIDESLRLNPPAMAMLRTLTQPVEVCGFELPAGSRTLTPIGLLQRDPAIFEQPHQFEPQRWAGGPDSLPLWAFGAGSRQCIAQPLARAELETVVPMMLRRFRIRPAWPAMERPVVRGTIQVPHRSALVWTRRR